MLDHFALGNLVDIEEFSRDSVHIGMIRECQKIEEAEIVYDPITQEPKINKIISRIILNLELVPITVRTIPLWRLPADPSIMLKLNDQYYIVNAVSYNAMLVTGYPVNIDIELMEALWLKNL